jgi:hypothetical protein
MIKAIAKIATVALILVTTRKVRTTIPPTAYAP